MRRCSERLLAVFLGLLAACGGGSPTPPLNGEGTASNDPLSSALQQIERQLAEVGFEPVALSGEGFLTAGREQTETLDITTPGCLTLVAVSARGIRDLDSGVFAPDGEILAEDVEPDAHPTLQLCTLRPRRLYYHLHAYDGTGSYRYAAFRGPESALDRAADILGGRPGVYIEREDDGANEPRLREVTRGAERRGFEPMGEPITIPLARDQRIRVPLPVQEAHCYTVAVFLGIGLREVAVRVLDEAGHTVSRDTAAASQPAVQFCIDRDASFAAEMHAVQGAGEVRVALLSGEEQRVGGSSGLWLGERPPFRQAASLSETRPEVLSANQNDGFTDRGLVAGGRLVFGQAVLHSLSLREGCTRVTAAGGRGIGELGLRLVVDGEGSGELRGRGVVSGHVCVSTSTRVEAHLVSRYGQGEYEVRVSAGLPPASIRTLPLPLQAAVLDAAAAARSAGYPEFERLVSAGERLTFEGCRYIATLAADRSFEGTVVCDGAPVRDTSRVMFGR
ncbi:MAG: hypothetical protein AAGF12_30375 [Myxococcota bacterium]